MVRGSAVSQFDPAKLTHGQILWITLNIEIDNEEQKAGQCQECRLKSEHRHCSTCGKIMPNMEALDDETRAAVREAAEIASKGGG